MSRSSSNSGLGSSPPGSAHPARSTPSADLANDDGDFVMSMAESECDVKYRRVEVAPHISQGLHAGAMAHSMGDVMVIPSGYPHLNYESSGEAVPAFKGAINARPQKQHQYQVGHSGAIGDTHTHTHPGGNEKIFITPHFRRSGSAERALFRRRSESSTGGPSSSEGMERGSPLSDDNPYNDIQYEHQPLTPPESEAYWQPFGCAAATEDSDAPEGSPLVSPLPFAFRLERTNFMAKGDSNNRPSVDAMLGSLRTALADAGIDELDLRNGECVLECSFQRGNRFVSMWLRVYLPPDEACGQLHGKQSTQDEEMSGCSYLVEAQLREGDRLHFSALFRDLMKAFKSQNNGMSIAGTYRYKSRAEVGTGEGLVLEEASFSPSRQSLRLLVEQRDEIMSASSQPVTMRRALAEGFAGGVDAMPRDISRPPFVGSAPLMPAGMEDNKAEVFDKDTADDVILLAGMLAGKYLDVQTDASTAVAGLTADAKFVQSLSQAQAAGAASALCSASSRLLIETRHRPARRQAAVIVANLSTDPVCSATLMAADQSSGTTASGGGYQLVQMLVGMAMGVRGVNDADHVKKVEEEIGTRRECMRALVGLMECGALQPHEHSAVKALIECDPTGKGVNDLCLMARLRKCRELLQAKRESS